jgi:diguanylate cyclase (GGDEF)-like protein/PAS domain S-box-containing protein
MPLVAALIYWVIVALWAAVLTTVCISYCRNMRTFGAARLLLSVLAIDTVRNIIENVYFGFYFGAQYGLFPGAIAGVLGSPTLLIIPKIINIFAACMVLGLLLMRWLPEAARERSNTNEDLRHTSDALRQESEERRRLFETSLDLILITDRRGNFVRVSPSSAAILGYSPDEMVGHSAVEFIYPDDLDPTRREMRLARTGHETRNFESRYIHRGGRVITLAWSGVWSEPEQKHFFIGRDMSERKVAEEKLLHLAHYDQLTGLPNRVSLRKDLGELIERCREPNGEPIAIAMFDLDGFKDVNDTLGHSTGDELLQEVARRLTALAAGANIYRLGGDEFVAILPRCGGQAEVAEFVAQVLKHLSDCFYIKEQRLFIGASAGVAMAPADGSDVEELIASADLALYAAKASGGNSCRFFVPDLRAKAQERRVLDLELRRAHVDGEFELFYQPQIRLNDGMVVGAEALLRWRHPERGVLAPAAFIDTLASSGLAHEVGNWILRTACQQMAAWHAKSFPPIRIGVNLFPVQLHNGTLLEDVEAALSRSGLPPEALELEITENIALGSDETMLMPLAALRERGVGLAFDDFGTGYASLIYLTRFPLSRIKIDQSFVRKISDIDKTEDTAIVRSVIVMAHNLGLEVIAEGVETVEQAAFLRTQGCEEVQGYLYAKPLPAREFEQFLAGNVSGANVRQADWPKRLVS